MFEAVAIDQVALRAWRLDRLRAEMKARDVAAALFYDPINIRYATGSSNMQVWVLHNPVRYVFVPLEGPITLFDFHGCAHLSDGIEVIAEVRPARAWTYFAAGPVVDERATLWAGEIVDLWRQWAPGGRLAVDRLEPIGVEALTRHGIRLADGQAVSEAARRIKGPEEVKAMRLAIASAEAGMAAMQAALQPGMTENEVWSILHQVNISRGGEWIETRLLASGQRTNPWFQECGHRVIETGDLVCFDTDLIGPEGYCADISRSWRAGDGMPNDRQRRIYAIAHEQVTRNIEVLKPGMTHTEFTELGFQLPDPYRAQRYSVIAHGVGLCDEFPSVVYPEDVAMAGYEGVLEPGMTVCVESYVGEVGGPDGVKLEEQLLITETGVEVLSGYPFEERFL
ncbi:M24 family metallopeptidase [Oceanibacterium hippocampi]|uniref:Putative peptidase n=1 Tax=Oceanibacterium hippocampi TaxID=745714 RepID=A0A1Y5RE87_9PROT|nr:Xaa-Pro peptidase family protein [Oceanibacterium hippocampi]SLN15183.1 putative peptidase [Oceanibacterium hippocampi]